jgi:hypothetical protein
MRQINSIKAWALLGRFLAMRITTSVLIRWRGYGCRTLLDSLSRARIECRVGCEAMTDIGSEGRSSDQESGLRPELRVRAVHIASGCPLCRQKFEPRGAKRPLKSHTDCRWRHISSAGNRDVYWYRDIPKQYNTAEECTAIVTHLHSFHS